MATVTGIGRADRLDSHGAAELYERHSARIFGYCLARLGAREDAEDATQLTFLHAVRGLRRGVVPTAESAWLFGIARNVCLSRWAAAGRRRRVESACDPVDLERLAASHDPHRDELIGLERALELLPEQQRRAVLLRDWRGLSYEEVAEELGVSHAAVETLIFRGRAALAESLAVDKTDSRRRLHSLGWLWSPFEAIKSGFAGAATGAKVAAAVGAIATISGGGVAVANLSGAAPAKPAQKPAQERQSDVRSAGVAVAPGASARTVPGRAPAAGGRGSQTSASGVAGTADAGPVAAQPELPVATDDPGGGPTTNGPEAAPPPASPAAPAPGAPVAEQPVPATPTVATPVTAAPAVDAPAVDAPVELPSTEAVAAAVEPVATAVTGTVGAVPLPTVPVVATPELPTAPPLPLPPPPAVPTVPALPTTPSLP